MDLTYTAAEEVFRGQLREFLARNVPGEEPPDDPDAEFGWLRLFQRRMFAGGWCGIHWPRAFGGRDATPTEQAIFVEEMARARAPQLVNRVGINNVGPTIMHYGTEAQRQRWLPGILSADEIWCQLYSEPDAGSDLASLRTAAIADGDGWRVSGQKVWTSYAQHAQWGILLARTDAAAPPHRGISYFVVEMNQPGVEVRPLRQLDGSVDFNEVFLEDVRIPSDHLIGDRDGGWKISTLTLAHERGTNFAFKEQALAKIALQEILEEAGRRGRLADPVFRQAAARLHTEVEIMRLLNLGTLTRIGRGEVPGAETSIVKEHWSRLVQDLGDLSLQVLGAAGQLRQTTDHSPGGGRFVQRMLFSRAASIAGGTSEIQKNIIAQRLLDCRAPEENHEMAHDLGKGWLGNFFEDFELGKEQVCAPPRVIGAPETALHIGTTNDRQARFCGGEGRMHPLVVFHTVIGQTVRNISLNSPANLGYSKMIWHAPVFAGDEITTTIKIVGLKENSNGKTGNCFVETTGRNQSGEIVLQYTRWVMVRKRDHDTATPYLENPVTPSLASQVEVAELPAWSGDLSRSEKTGGSYFFEDYEPGERIFHHDGMTVNHTDHMQYTRLWQNSAKVHFDEILTDGKPLVYGGFPFSIAYAQSLNGLENRSGMVAMNSGAHANPCYSGTTIYSFTEVLEAHDLIDQPYGALRLRLVGVKDLNPADHKDFDIGEDNGKGRIKYDPRVLLCMDIWELMPKRAG